MRVFELYFTLTLMQHKVSDADSTVAYTTGEEILFLLLFKLLTFKDIKDGKEGVKLICG